MEQAVVKTLKDADGTYSFPGGENKVIDLYCNDVKVKIVEVIINSSFTEFASYGANRIAALKLVSTCETAYILGTLSSLQNLQNCCPAKINYAIGLDCVPSNGGAVTVFNILGVSLGTATTPTAYAALWNSDPTNQIIGVLYVGTGWIFSLNLTAGNVKPTSLHCTTIAPTYVCPTGNTITSPSAGALRVVFTAAANKNYTVRLWNNSNGTGLQTSQTSNNTTGSAVVKTVDFTGLPGGTYYVEVRETASSTQCGLTSQVVVAVAQRQVQWQYFDNDPNFDGIGLDTYNYPNTQSHVANANISIPITGFTTNQWFVLRYPSDETDLITWYNTNLNNGTIPDSVFNSAVTIGSWKYLKTKDGEGFDVGQPLLFNH